MKARWQALCERLSKYAIFRLAMRYGELIRYAIVGVLTTGVNFAVYFLCTRALFPHLLARNEALYAFVFNCVAWAFAVLFAFLANRIFVFRSEDRGTRLLLQLLSFVALRVASGAIETVTPSLLIHLGMNDLLAKAIVSVAVIVLNYLFAKFITFAKGRRAGADAPSSDKDL